MLFGPAYKGISLAATTAVALADHHDRDLPFAFNRKEAKDHGEGGNIVGAALDGRIVIIDDVITAGTAIREVMGLIDGAGAEAVGWWWRWIARSAPATTPTSAIQQVQVEFGIPVVSIVGLDQVLAYLEQAGDTLKPHAEAIRAYRERYGVSA